MLVTSFLRASLVLLAWLFAGCGPSGYLERCEADGDCACPLRCELPGAFLVGAEPSGPGRCNFVVGPREPAWGVVFRPECAAVEPRTAGESCGQNRDCACPLECVFSLDPQEQRGSVPVCGEESDTNISFNATFCRPR